MTEKILVPSLGESVSEATIATVHKKVGDYVNKDEIIAEIESDKATLEVCASEAGVITQMNVSAEDEVAVGDLLCEIDTNATAPTSAPNDNQTNVTNTATNNNEQVSDSNIIPPSVKRMISEENVNINNIQGTGKNNMVTKTDIINQKSNKATTSSNEKPVERVKMSNLRKSIAKRLKDSQNTAAILSTFNEVDMTNVMALRSEYKDLFIKKHDIKLGFMSFFIKATILALKEIPAINAEIDGDHLVYKNYYDLGVAVGTPQGLVVPVLRNADQMSLAELEAELVRLGKKARDGKLGISDMTGGTFTISNGGVYGSLLSTPIINPPQSGILGMHNIVQRPVVVDGKIEARPMMYIALSYDHRIVDGKEAVTFLVKIKQIIEDPRRILIDV